MIIKLLVEGGSMKPGPTISQKLGPLGINIGKIISDVNTSTKDFNGLKIPVELDIDPKSKSVKILVLSPPASELLKKELGLEKASGEMKKIKVGNLSIEQIIKIAKIKFPNMLTKNLKAAVKNVVGSCVSLGILIESKEAKEIIQEINQGVYDNEIKNEITEVSKEKIKQLKDNFDKVKDKQDQLLKKEAEEKAAEEAAKQAAAPTTPTGPAAPVTAATTAKPGEEKKSAKK